MLKSLVNLTKKSTTVGKISVNCEEKLFNWTPRRCIHTTIAMNFLREKTDRKSRIKASVPKEDGVGSSAETFQFDYAPSRVDIFPDEHTPNQLFHGMPFKDIVILNLHISKNNTIMALAKPTGELVASRSCGMDGFKNTKKGTNIAAQTTAMNFARIVREKGFKVVRCCVKGLGPGRIASVKGLQMGGLTIVSITDTTPVSWNPPRPRKARRL